MRDVAVVVITVDREPSYLAATLANLARAGLWQSPRLHSLHLVDSGRVNPGYDVPWPDRALLDHAYVVGDAPWDPAPTACRLHVHRTDAPRSAKQNCAAALAIGARTGAAWVLQLEDDLDVCGDFLGSVARWLDDHAADDRHVYPLSGDNAQIAAVAARGAHSWEYPVASFWGFQCFAMRPQMALDFSQWLQDHPLYRHADGRLDENAHDLEIQRWAEARGITHFRGACPSFVQHIGLTTSIAQATGGAKVQFQSWPGPDWSYQQQQTGEVTQ